MAIFLPNFAKINIKFSILDMTKAVFDKKLTMLVMPIDKSTRKYPDFLSYPQTYPHYPQVFCPQR